MSKLRNVYLPGWIVWLSLAMLLPLWLWISYLAFFGRGDGSEVDLPVWILVTVIMGGMATVLVLMGKRKLPAYLMEVEEEGE